MRDEKGQFIKGNKEGGRPKGSKNKSTTEIRHNFQHLIDSNLPQLKEDLQALEPIERINAIVKLSKFVLPTMRASDVNFEASSTISKAAMEKAVKNLDKETFESLVEIAENLPSEELA